ncbi:MAG: type III PLP-dependent enzyme [Pirellulales bacterium]|jgi:ornithine decarboxylase
MNKKTLLQLAKTHGTPLFVIDHAELRKNYALFRKHFPRVQAYYAVKVNSDPVVVETFYKLGGSFDVASMQEFHTVYRFIEDLPPQERQDFIWDKIIYANPIKPIETLQELDRYKPLVTFDNEEEVKKIAKHAPNAGLALRLRVPNTGSMVELSSKFGALPGEAVQLIACAHDHGLTVEGVSFHVGSQCTNPENYIQAIHLSAGIFAEAKSRGFDLQLLDIGGGFPAAYDASVPRFATLAKKLNYELDRLFPKSIEILAEPGRFLVASAGSAVSKIIGKAVRNDKLCYYVDDGVYHTYSGIIFDHCTYRMKSFKAGPTQLCAVFGPTCDALDTISLAEQLPDLKIGDYLYSNTIGAYSAASSTHFNGFPPAKVVHVNR